MRTVYPLFRFEHIGGESDEWVCKPLSTNCALGTVYFNARYRQYKYQSNGVRALSAHWRSDDITDFLRQLNRARRGQDVHLG